MKHLKIDTKGPVDQQVDQLAARLSMESEVLQDFTDLLAKSIPALGQSLAASFQKSLNLFQGFISGFSPDSRLLNFANTVPYSALAPMKIYVPEGFSGNALEYVQLLKESVTHTEDLVANVINPYNGFLSALISNPDSAKNTAIRPAIFDRKDRERDELNMKIGKFFKNGTSSTGKYEQFFKRNLELVESKRDLDQIYRDLTKISPSTVQKAVNDTIDLIAGLESVLPKEQLKQISPQTVKFLAEATLTVAKEVEFYGITRYRSETFVKCFEETLALLKKVQ